MMNKKQIAKFIKDKMPNFEGTDEEKQVKTALFIYVELGKIKSFNTQYYFGNTETKRKIYQLARQECADIDKIANKRKITCVTMTRLYISILRDLGIYAYPSRMDDDPVHEFPVVTLTSGEEFVADLQADLTNIQTKSRLEYFGYLGKCDNMKDARNALTQKLIEIGYIKNENDYKNKEIERLKKMEVSEMPTHKALKTILEDDNLYAGNEDMGIVEQNLFFKAILMDVVPNFYNNGIYCFNCERDNKYGEHTYGTCIYSKDDSPNSDKKIKAYMYSKRNKKFIQVPIELMQYLNNSGAKFGLRRKEQKASKIMSNYLESLKKQESKERNES